MTSLPRVTLDAHAIVGVLYPPIILPDLGAEEPAVKLADHVVQLLAGVGHLVNHPELVVSQQHCDEDSLLNGAQFLKECHPI